MHSLKNDQLEVLVLDPEADKERFHTRYCVGGYIYQIHDAQHGALMSGPTYPDSFNTYDGQGIPDAFNLNPLRRTDDASTTALIIGVGLCDLAADTVVEFSPWTVAHEGLFDPYENHPCIRALCHGIRSAGNVERAYRTVVDPPEKYGLHIDSHTLVSSPVLPPPQNR